MVNILILILIFLIFIISLIYVKKKEHFEISDRKCLGYPNKKKKYKDNLFFHIFFNNHKKKDIHKKYKNIFLKSKLLNNIFDKNTNKDTEYTEDTEDNNDKNNINTTNNIEYKENYIKKNKNKDKNLKGEDIVNIKNNFEIKKDFPDYNPLNNEFKNLKIGVDNSFEKFDIDYYSKDYLFSKNFDNNNQYDLRNIYESNDIYLDKRNPKFDKIEWNFKKNKSLIPKNFKFLDKDYFTNKQDKFKYKRYPKYNLVDYRKDNNNKSNKYLYSNNNFFNIKTINSLWEKNI